MEQWLTMELEKEKNIEIQIRWTDGKTGTLPKLIGK